MNLDPNSMQYVTSANAGNLVLGWHTYYMFIEICIACCKEERGLKN